MKNIVLWSGESLGCLAIFGVLLLIAVASFIGANAWAAIVGVVFYAGVIYWCLKVGRWVTSRILSMRRNTIQRRAAIKRKEHLMGVVERYGTDLQRGRVKQGYGDLEKEAAAALEPTVFAPIREAGFKPLGSNGEFMDAKEVGDIEFELISAVAKLIPDAQVKPAKSVNGNGPTVHVEVLREGVCVSKSFCRERMLSS